MRVLVCGGRRFFDKRLLDQTLSALTPPPTVIIEGEASGADILAREWAKSHGIPFEPYPADWDNITRPGAVVKRRYDGKFYDAAAGHIRNQKMLVEGKPDLVVAMPGGSGTADMVRRARAARVPVQQPECPFTWQDERKPAEGKPT
jgi:hypothetical protein